MCLYPRLVKNPKYLVNKKNGGNVPAMVDERVKYVPIGCGQCYECRNKKKREWQVRLLQEFKNDMRCKFVTLTFSDESIQDLYDRFSNSESNYIASKAIRLFLERWRKATKKSVKHWLITELGHKNTERIHLHGIIWTDRDDKFIEDRWHYGNIFVGQFCNEQTINYIIKYITKIDHDHQGYQPQIFCSAGIGRGYEETPNGIDNRYKEEGDTNEAFRTPQGYKIALPIYYRNKIYTEEQREKLWIEKLDRGIRYIDGVKVNADDLEKIDQLLTIAQEKNKRLGYGDLSKEWQKKEYNATNRMLNKSNKVFVHKLIEKWNKPENKDISAPAFLHQELKRLNRLDEWKSLSKLWVEILKQK